MALKYLPVTFMYKNVDYYEGLIQEVPDELAKMIDEYNEKNKLVEKEVEVIEIDKAEFDEETQEIKAPRRRKVVSTPVEE